jgi:hypothetical protein
MYMYMYDCTAMEANSLNCWQTKNSPISTMEETEKWSGLGEGGRWMERGRARLRWELGGSGLGRLSDDGDMDW